MKYRAKCKHCLSQLKNISAYVAALICKDAHDIYIEVDTDEEVELIEKFDRKMSEALKIYEELIELTINNH